MTTTTPRLTAVPEPGGDGALRAISEAARSATLAQNFTGARRLAAADRIVTEFASREECDETRRRGYARLAPESRARDHLAAACQLTTWHAARLVTAGMQVHRRLPKVRAMVEEGLLPEQLAIDLACRLAEVPDDIVGAVEAYITAKLRGDLEGGDRPSKPRMDKMVDSAIEDADPRAAQDAVDAATEERKVRVRQSGNGMATLWAKLPAADAEMLWRRIQNDADVAAKNGSPRPIDQLRADALSALAVYRPTMTTGCNCGGGTGGDSADGEASDGEASGADDNHGFDIAEVGLGPDLPRPTVGNAAAATGQQIRITVIASAAHGRPNRVEFINGAYSSFDWLCQELLEGDDARVRFEIIDPTPGAMDDPAQRLRYVISPSLAERIRLRDGTCRHPGCSVEARDCDIDHVIAFNRDEPALGGPTVEWNLMCLCRSHHREKTFGGATYQLGALGDLVITTETGHRHRTRPTGPLAMARDSIQERDMIERIARLISRDGYISNPPGTERGDWSA